MVAVGQNRRDEMIETRSNRDNEISMAVDIDWQWSCHCALSKSESELLRVGTTPALDTPIYELV